MLSETRAIDEDHSTLSSQYVMMNVRNRLPHLMHKAEAKWSKALRKYKLYFGRVAEHTWKLTVSYMIYVDNSLAPKRNKRMVLTAKDSSVKLQRRSFGPFRIRGATPHTEIINIDGIHGIVAVTQVTFAQADHETKQDASKENRDNRPKTIRVTALVGVKWKSVL